MYKPTKWMDHVTDEATGEVIQEGTNQSAGNFNKMERGITDGAVAQAISLIAAERLGDEVKGKKSPRVARFVVGTATNGWTLNDCDFLCDGINDEREIRAAIEAIPEGGGEVVLLDGTYHIQTSSEITINKENTTLRGSANTTISIEQYVARTILVTADSCAVRDINLVNNCGYTRLYGVSASNVAGLVIENINAKNYSDAQILLKTATGCTIKGCTLTGGEGFDSAIFTEDLSDTIIAENKIVGPFSTGIGLSKNTSTGQNFILSNTISQCSLYGIACNYPATVCGNSVVNSATGIHVNTRSIVEGNTVIDCDDGIHVYGDEICVTGNIVKRGEGTTADYSNEQHTILVSGNHNCIIANLTRGKLPDHSGTGNTIAYNGQ